MEIASSTLRGKGAGFFLELLDKEDSVQIRNSTLDFPLSLWIRIYGRGESGEGGGLMRLINSEFKSVDPKSQGIIITVSEENGVGHFERLKFETSKDEGVVWAGACFWKDVAGAQHRCFNKLSSAP